jgi:riboflavin kinase / FMN adenylyltransferase
MKRIFGSESFPVELEGAVVALGNFDGVHLGHQEIIRATIDDAVSSGRISAAYTFDPHPVKVLAPEQCPQLIQTLNQKLDALESLGLDICIVENFNEEFAHIEPDDFFKKIIVDRIGASEVIVGYDFTFGRHRLGTTESLHTLANDHGVGISIVEAQLQGEILISSTNIRGLIARGEVREAAKLLGRPYSVDGMVIPGRGIGRSLNARTANIDPLNELIPGHGIYISRTHIVDANATSSHPSITSIGDNPTFPESGFAFETHIIDEDIDLTGKQLRIELIVRLRDQRAFKSTEELKEQIHRDIEFARNYHNEG